MIGSAGTRKWQQRRRRARGLLPAGQCRRGQTCVCNVERRECQSQGSLDQQWSPTCHLVRWMGCWGAWQWGAGAAGVVGPWDAGWLADWHLACAGAVAMAPSHYEASLYTAGTELQPDFVSVEGGNFAVYPPAPGFLNRELPEVWWCPVPTPIKAPAPTTPTPTTTTIAAIAPAKHQPSGHHTNHNNHNNRTQPPQRV